GQQLQRHVAVQHLIPGAINDTHAAFAKLGNDSVVIQRLSDHGRFRRPSYHALSSEQGASNQEAVHKRLKVAAGGGGECGPPAMGIESFSVCNLKVLQQLRKSEENENHDSKRHRSA